MGAFPAAPRARHDISAAAEHRMHLAVRHLRMIGGQASGLISEQDLARAVRSESERHHYDQVVLAVGRQRSSGLDRVLGRDPVHRLRRQWGEHLIVFPDAR
jgi:hypothetical protein